jgi:hypothetical protein
MAVHNVDVLRVVPFANAMHSFTTILALIFFLDTSSFGQSDAR